MSPSSAFDSRDLRLRIASALVIGPAALAAVWFGQGELSWIFMIWIAVAAAVLALEWGAMSAPGRPARVAAVVTAGVLVAVFCAHFGVWTLAWASLLAGAVGAAAIARKFSGRKTDAAFGVLYIGIPSVLILWLRTGDQGRAWVLALLLLVWAADGAAYFVGKSLGGPKLWPRFSPNKTWSGFFGGLLGAALAGVAFRAVLGPTLNFEPSYPLMLGAGMLIGLSAMAGDLWESMLKRRFGVKDSGAIIPGHGGLLDRVDGLMFAVLTASAIRWAFERGLVG